MKHFLSIVYMVILFGCVKRDHEPEPNPSSAKGTFTFWVQSDLGVGPIDVYVDDEYEGTINHFHPDGVTCGGGDVNVEKEAGTYTWEAESEDGTTWDGTVTVKSGKCSNIEL